MLAMLVENSILMALISLIYWLQHGGIAATTDWATLAGGNGDIGWANFSAGYYVK